MLHGVDAMIASGGVTLIDQPTFIQGKQVEYIVLAGNVSYKATAKVILEAVLRKAAGINRYLYTAVSVNVFDPAFTDAQAAYDDPTSTDTDYIAATEALRAAIDALVKATFTGPKSILAKIGKLQPFASVFSYDGIGTLEISDSSNPGVCNLTDNGAMLVPLKAGIAIVTVRIKEAPEIFLAGIAITVSV